MNCLAVVLLTLLSTQDHPDKASPFDELRWTGQQTPEVSVGQTWYRPIAIDEVEVTTILEFCRRRWPGQLEKRFGEDLMQAMATLGHAPGATVTLRVVPVDGSAEVTLADVANTRAKRDALRDATRGTARVGPRRSTLTREQALADLEAFAAGLAGQFAYLGLRPVALDDELEQLAATLGDDVSVPAFAARLNRLLMRFGDGHATVTSPVKDPQLATGSAPALLADTAAGVVAFREDRKGFLDAEHPLLLSIDGEPLQAWLDAVRPDVADGSPQLVRRRSLAALRALAELRRKRGLSVDADVILGLTSPDGSSTIQKALPLGRRRPQYGVWPRNDSALLDGNLGYLRLPHMDQASSDHIRAVLPALKDTVGLIVDVRGNGGGSRQALLDLAGFLIGPDQPPVVANIAAYRLAPAFDRDHLEPRFMRRADWPGWTPAQAAAIARAAASFEPEWTLPEGFSPWHYLVLDRTGAKGEFFYEGPVVVLSDAGCFSATDIFLGALALLPQVTLIGQPSSGGSARSQAFRLPQSRIQVRCASMASFRPDGRLYDGRGVEMDVQVAQQPGDLLLDGGDAQLQAALRALGN